MWEGNYLTKSCGQLLTVEGFTAPARGLELTAAYGTHLGALVAGQKVFVRLRPLKAGFQGELVRCMGLVAARLA